MNAPREIPKEIESDHRTEISEKDLKVTIRVNGKDMLVAIGECFVSEFKKLICVDTAHDLDQVIGGQFKPLKADDRIEPKDRDIFCSHGRGGGSS